MSLLPEQNKALANKTRTSSSIVDRLLREGRFYLVPVYWFLRTSDLAREGVENSGSFRFADHIYKYEASGDYGIGWLLDWVVLRLPSSRSFRNRYLSARDAIVKVARELAPQRDEIHVLSIPSGLPREMRDAAVILRRESPEVFAKCRWHGMDLDAEPLSLSAPFFGEERIEHHDFRQGNALNAADFPAGMDIVTSTGLADFLTDEQLEQFYRNVYGCLRPGGAFHTSGMKMHRLSDWLMRNLAELHTQYRDMDGLESLAVRAGFSRIRLAYDDVGIQTLMIARK